MPPTPTLVPRDVRTRKAHALPELPPHPQFTKAHVNDARTVLVSILEHGRHFQIDKARVKTETDLSHRRLTKALQYLRTLGFLSDVVVRKNGRLYGSVFRINLDGQVEKGGWVLHYSQCRDERNDFGARKRQMRRSKAGLGSSSKSTHQCETAPLGPEGFSPCTPYNDEPPTEREKRPLSPFQGESDFSLPGEVVGLEFEGSVEAPEAPDTDEELEQQELEHPDVEVSEFETMSPESLDKIRTETAKHKQSAPTHLLLGAAGCLAAISGIHPGVDLLKITNNPASPMYRRLGVDAVEALRTGPRLNGRQALLWMQTSLPGLMLRQCMLPGDSMTEWAARAFVRKLRRNTLTVDHFARYWVGVRGRHLRPQSIEQLVRNLQETCRVPDGEESNRQECFTLMTSKERDHAGHEFFDAEDYWSHHLEKSLTRYNDKRWSVRHLTIKRLEILKWDTRDLDLSIEDNLRARITAHVLRDSPHFPNLGSLQQAIAESKNTLDEIIKWLTETDHGLEAAIQIKNQLGCWMTLEDILGISKLELDARRHLHHTFMQAAREQHKNYRDSEIGSLHLYSTY